LFYIRVISSCAFRDIYYLKKVHISGKELGMGKTWEWEYGFVMKTGVNGMGMSSEWEQ